MASWRIRRSFLFFVAILCLSSSVQAAVSFAELELKSYEELEVMLDAAPLQDHGRIKIAMARWAIESDPVHSDQLLQQAGGLLALDDVVGEVVRNSYTCFVQTIRSEFEQATASCKAAVYSAEETRDIWALLKAHNAQAVLWYQQGELAKASSSGFYAIRASLQTGVPEVVANQYNNMALYARAQGLYQNAIGYYTQALELLADTEKNDNSLLISFNLGVSYADLDQHEHARDFYLRTLEWAQDNGRYLRELQALIYLARSDNALGRYAVAEKSMRKVLSEPNFTHFPSYRAFTYAMLGESLFGQGRIEEALVAYREGLDLVQAEKANFEQRHLDIGYAKALSANAQNIQAIQHLTSAIDKLRAENSRLMLVDALQLLAQLQEAKGDYAASLEAYKEYDSVAIELQQSAFDHQLALARAQFEVDQQERLLVELDRDRIVRNGLIMLVIGLALIAYLFVTRRRQQQRVEARNLQAKELEMLVDERTRELRSQIIQAENAQAARRTLERQLAEAEKLRVLGQLTGGVAHDFNNLLTVIIGAAELLKDNADVEFGELGLLDHILTAAGSGADITRALMAYARKQPLQLETVDLKQLLQARIPLIDRTLGALVSVDLQLTQVTDIKVTLDPAQLTSALLNLCLNARDAQNNQGEILVNLSIREDKWAVILVKDHGVGMTREQLSRAVEPFYSTKHDVQGSGLGLSMVYGFSKQLGGDLEIESDPGAGTNMRIVLPLASNSVRVSGEQKIGAV